MKNLFALVMLVFVSCSLAPEKKSPVIGVWKSTPPEYHGWKGSTVKIWTATYCTYVGEFRKDTVIYNVFGGGPYKIDGTHVEETISYNMDKNTIGKTFKMVYVVKGDTLFQYYPADENWKYDTKTCNIDKYVRIE